MNIYFKCIMETQSETTPTPAPTSSLSDSTPPAAPEVGTQDSQGEASSANRVRLAAIEIDSEVTALNVLVQFLGLAQKRGAFTIDEAAKIWECVQKFQRPLPDATSKDA
jgi:hypothetical protein